jgi:hypothetical protein
MSKTPKKTTFQTQFNKDKKLSKSQIWLDFYQLGGLWGYRLR